MLKRVPLIDGPSRSVIGEALIDENCRTQRKVFGKEYVSLSRIASRYSYEYFDLPEPHVEMFLIPVT